MTISVLLVEDDQSFVDVVRSIILGSASDISLTVCRSSNSAISTLETQPFDIIILDLKLPSNDESLDLDVEHGRSVFESTRRSAPGTPVIILTGSPAEGFIKDFLRRSTQVDVWGDGTKIHNIDFVRKSELDELEETLRPRFASIQAVEEVEIRSGINLTWAQDRLVKIFVRRRGGVSCTIHPISGGLSGARTFRVLVMNDRGVSLLNSVIKIGSLEMVENEHQKYNRYAPMLQESATARLVEDVRYGAGKAAAISYRMADAFTRTMFDVAQHSPCEAPAVIQAVAELLRPWRDGVPETRVTVGDVRRRLLSDERAAQLAEKYDLNWISKTENRHLQVRWCCIHGDLHGGNVLVDHVRTPILIDYGDIGDGPAALDWINLELSLLFHPDGAARGSDWPAVRSCASWAEVSVYADKGPFRPYIEACRSISELACAGPREVSACAYAYLLRQLYYDDTDKARALALLESVRTHLNSV